MCAEDLLQQSCAAARVTAEKSKLIVILTGSGCFVAPAADRLRGDGRQQIQAFALGLIVAAFQRCSVGDGSQRRLGLQQPCHGFVILAEFIQQHAQQVSAGIFDVGVLRAVADQVAQFHFGLAGEFLAVEQEGAKIAHLVVSGMAGTAGFDLVPGLGQPTVLFQPNGQVDAGIDRFRVGGDGPLKTGPSVGQLTQALELMTDE